jgi:hypothetical protein
MMKKFFLALLIIILASDSGAYAEKRTSPTSTKEEMIEDILFQYYAPQLLKITNKLYECEKILSIKKINNKHLIEVGLTTFTGPHNPPNDFYSITFIDSPIGPEQPFEIHLENVARTENISN